jgi:glycogen phosphorylase
MKFALNGALTIGTLDGANIEIRDAVGAENFFLFGLTADEVYALKARGYDPCHYFNRNAELQDVINGIASGRFSHGDSGLFHPLLDNLLHQDPYMLFADYQSYVECHDHVARVYADRDRWTRMSILNTARMGFFSSDRAIKQYAQEIWDARPVHVDLQDLSPAEV